MSEGGLQPPWTSRLCVSEVMTIVVSFPQSGYRTFKDYFLRYVTPHLAWAFPHIVSFTRFVESLQASLIPLCAYLQTRKGKSQNVDDRKPVPHLLRGLHGKVFGDRGSISQALFTSLFAHGVHLITKLRKDRKNKLLPLMDKLLLRKRSLIETVNEQLKNISQIEHSRHRSIATLVSPPSW
jgi:hypothetical protein